MFEKLLDLFRLLLVHKPEEFLGLFLGEVAEDVGRFVRLHLFQYVRGLFAVHLAYDPAPEFRFQFVDCLTCGLGVEGGEDRLDVLVRDLRHDMGDVGGVHLRQLVPRHGQGEHGEVHLQRLNVFPADLLSGKLFPETPIEPLPDPFVSEATQQPP